MRVTFFGTPEFAVPSLAALRRDHDVVLVVTAPDRPAGRGLELRSSPVARLARNAGLPLLQPPSLRDKSQLDAIRAVQAEIVVVAAYGQILPAELLDYAPNRAINVHASLLPRWRGASPVAAAILAGDAETGVSIMRMEPSLDTGPLLLQRRERVRDDDTAASLSERLAALGATALTQALELIIRGDAVFAPQSSEGATYAGLVKKADGDLDWDRPAPLIARALRAYHPWPGVRVPLLGERVRLLEGGVLPAWTVTGEAGPGEVVERGADGLVVMTGAGPLLVRTVQPPGGKAMSAADYARGRRGKGSTSAAAGARHKLVDVGD